MRVVFLYIVIIAFCLANLYLSAQDSTAQMLQDILFKSLKKEEGFNKATPVQILDKKTLNYLNAPTVGDAARFFSGVQLKDYGGAGGLKTISVRSLGASHTGILYDGIPVSDVQAGQTDLSRYSTNHLQSISLYNANSSLLLPARAYAAASLLAMYTPTFYPALMSRNTWQAGVRNGSFGYWQGFASVNQVLPKQGTVSMVTEAVVSDGDYPFTVNNGNQSEKNRRANGRINSIQGEVNFSKQFKDSAVLQVKGWGFQSQRGLPGAITFFNNRSVQSLFNNDFFGQFRYQRRLFTQTSLLASGKLSHSYTRYRDPDFLNNNGGLDDRYKQNEIYGSIAIGQPIFRGISGSLAGDITHTTLRSEKFPNRPARIGIWTNLAMAYTDSLWKVQTSLLWSAFEDETPDNLQVSRNKITPSFALSRTLSKQLPLMLRFFYKQVCRMPTFNDLYYNFLGNSSLRPELARQHNLGLTYSLKPQKKYTINLSIDGYINRISDKIVAVPTQNLFSWTMLNLGTVDIKGIDFTTELNGEINSHWAWTGRLSYTWQRANDITNRSSPTYGDRIPYAPDHSGSSVLSLSFRRWAAGYNLVFSGSRYTLGGNNYFNRLNGWNVHDFFVLRNIALGKIECTLKAELNNFTNQQYDIIRFYPMPGRTYKVSIIIHQ